MPIYLGSTNLANTQRLGTTAISKIYLGSNQVYPAYRADTTAWLNAATGTYSDTEKSALNTFLQGLEDDAILSLFDRLWLFQFGDNQADALRDLIGRNSATAVNSPAFTRRQGFKGDRTSYIDTNLVLSSAVQYQQNSASLGVYIRIVDTSIGSTRDLIGASDGTRYTRIFSGGTNGVGRINQADSTGSNASNVSQNTSGNLYMLARSGASASVLRKDASASNGAAVSNGRPTVTCFIGARNASNVTLANPTDAQISLGWIGGNLTIDQYNAFRARLSTFNTAIGFT